MLLGRLGCWRNGRIDFLRIKGNIMGIRQNTIITKTCTYDLPDDYLYQTNTLGLTGSYEYEGPDKLWIFVNEETGMPINGQVYTERDDGDEVPAPQGTIKVFVDANVETVLASMIWRHKDYSYLPTITEQLPDNTSYTRPEVQPPDHTYEFMECVYNVATNEWVKPFPWKKPHMTWEGIRQGRLSLLAASDRVLATTLLTTSEAAEYEVYRQKLRDLPAVFEGVDPWKIIFPEPPVIGAN
jgi:hypothetical protein